MERTTSEPPLWSLTVANEPRYEVPTPTTEEVLESSKAYDTVAATVTKAVAPEQITDALFRPKRRDYNYLTFRKYLSNFRSRLLGAIFVG